MIITNTTSVAKVLNYKVNGQRKSVRIPGQTSILLPDLTSKSQILYNLYDLKVNHIVDVLGRRIHPFLENVTSSSGSYDPDALLYFNQLPIPPLTSMKNIINTDVTSLKANSNNFSKLDRLVFCDGTYRDNAYYSVVNPTSPPLQEVKSIKWNNYGFQGAASSYIKTQFTPSANGSQYQRNSACFFYWVINDVDDGGCDIGSQNFGGSPEKAAFSFGKTGGLIAGSLNDDSGSSIQVSILNGAGLISFVRTNSNTVQIWKNGVLIQTTTMASTGLPDLEFYLLGLNRSGTLAFASTARQISLYGVGSGTINQLELYNTLLAHRNSVATLYPSPSAPIVKPLDDAKVKLSIPSLTDSSGNGLNSVLGASLPGGFTAPTLSNGDIVFNGNQTIHINSGFTLAALNTHTQFFTIYTDTPEITQNLVNVGGSLCCWNKDHCL